MSAKDFTKSQRKEIRRLGGIAYQRDLELATGKLENEFVRWRKGEIDVFELNQRIHDFHDGPSRDLYKFYVLGEFHWGVASGLASGILDESEVDADIRQKMTGLIDFFVQEPKDVEQDAGE